MLAKARYAIRLLLRDRAFPLAAGRPEMSSSTMPGVSSIDPLVLGIVPALLTGVALTACLDPVCRALRLTPVDTLRME